MTNQTINVIILASAVFLAAVVMRHDETAVRCSIIAAGAAWVIMREFCEWWAVIDLTGWDDDDQDAV